MKTSNYLTDDWLFDLDIFNSSALDSMRSSYILYPLQKPVERRFLHTLKSLLRHFHILYFTNKRHLKVEGFNYCCFVVCTTKSVLNFYRVNGFRSFPSSENGNFIVNQQQKQALFALIKIIIHATLQNINTNLCFSFVSGQCGCKQNSRQVNFVKFLPRQLLVGKFNHGPQSIGQGFG